MDHLKEYKHVIPIQIRFSDIDRLNHVNNACYLNFFELGRVSYFNQVLNTHINWNERGFVLARTELDHIEPIYLHDEVYCYTKVTRFGTKSLTIQNAIAKKGKEGTVLCAEGLGILVAMDYTKTESIEVPALWKQLMEDFEK